MLVLVLVLARVVGGSGGHGGRGGCGRGGGAPARPYSLLVIGRAIRVRAIARLQSVFTD